MYSAAKLQIYGKIPKLYKIYRRDTVKQQGFTWKFFKYTNIIVPFVLYVLKKY